MDAIRPPFLTAELPGIGGRLKVEPRHFVVRELPLYQPSGSGEHLYLTLTRENANTADLARDMARLLDLRPDAVGTAGRKDRRALVTQTFSLYLPGDVRPPEQVAAEIAEALPVQVIGAVRHENKLRMGHLAGNEFEIFASDVSGDALERAAAITAELSRRGLPNYFGPQRFGKDGGNIERGRAVLRGKSRPRNRGLSELFVSAFQSSLFNLWLGERLLRGDFERMLPGDVAQRLDSGGLFDVDDAPAETERLHRGEIAYTGPLFGKKMREAADEAGEREAELLRKAGLKPADFRRATGARRPGRLPFPDVALETKGGGLWLRFRLPKGAYATSLLREFMKTADETEAGD